MSREQSLVQRARKAFQTGKSKPLEYRLHQLRCLHRFITERHRDIADALKKDLCKVMVVLTTGHTRLFCKCLKDSQLL